MLAKTPQDALLANLSPISMMLASGATGNFSAYGACTCVSSLTRPSAARGQMTTLSTSTAVGQDNTQQQGTQDR